MPPRSLKHNVIIFGEAGSGKSSIVNMLLGENVAKVAGGPFGCTLESKPYDLHIGHTTYCLHDTAGLNEIEQGRVPHLDAIANLYTLIRRLDGMSLLIFCMQGRMKENSRANWILFNNVICREKVPIIAVVTGVENEEPEEWEGQVKDMKESFLVLEMKPLTVEFIVPIRGKRDEFEDLYKASKEKLVQVIQKYTLPTPWSAEKEELFQNNFYREYVTKFCPFVMTEVQFTSAMEEIIDEYAVKTNMSEKEAKNIRLTLLGAEKKVYREQHGQQGKTE